ncbi:MAG: peptide deformylase [Saprospiraceae bacterium]|jgi:peptide deformylase|tara:strand:+ start:726 stop:1295 length:570 start_codon:yes stop_codon:yes gene_type:complete
MVLPIYAYGQPVLKKETEDITKDYPNLQKLIDNMFETMYHAEGVGLAAPQIGLGIRLFIMDTVQIQDEGQEGLGIKKVFINATILEEKGEEWIYEEGCLSIPKITGDVERQPRILIEYYDENFKLHEEWHDDMNARVIQHEYDHVDGILFLEHLKPLKKRMLKRKLESLKKGDTEADYKMVFYNAKKRR